MRTITVFEDAEDLMRAVNPVRQEGDKFPSLPPEAKVVVNTRTGAVFLENAPDFQVENVSFLGLVRAGALRLGFPLETIE